MSELTLSPGVQVRLRVSGNTRLDGALAVVEVVESWGCHVRTRAAATGQFRAAWDEMEPLSSARDSGFTGDCCSTCGSMTCVRNGSCLLCTNCGATSGCS